MIPNTTGVVVSVALEALAASRLAIVLGADEITAPARGYLDSFATEEKGYPFIARLASCPTWCLSVWTAAAVTAKHRSLSRTFAVAFLAVPLTRQLQRWHEVEPTTMGPIVGSIVARSNARLQEAEAALMNASTAQVESLSRAEAA